MKEHTNTRSLRTRVGKTLKRNIEKLDRLNGTPRRTRLTAETYKKGVMTNDWHF